MGKNYRCKNEELPVIGGFVQFMLKRDLEQFTAFSPKFNTAYIRSFESKITVAKELLNPRNETVEMKAATASMYAHIDSLTALTNSVVAYLKMAEKQIPLPVADFGTSALLKKIRSRDVEGILQNVNIVIGNIELYKDILTQQGLTDSMIAEIRSTAENVNAENQRQYELMSKRKQLTQSNQKILNDLYSEISEICTVGKTLYKNVNTEKVKEYTFAELMKKVRIVHAPKKNAADTAQTSKE
jgi:hypothetical protein